MDALRRSVQAGRPAAKKGKRLAAIAAWPQGGVPARREIQPVSLSRPSPARAAALERAAYVLFEGYRPDRRNSGTAIARLSVWTPQISLPGDKARAGIGMGLTARRPEARDAPCRSRALPGLDQKVKNGDAAAMQRVIEAGG